MTSQPRPLFHARLSTSYPQPVDALPPPLLQVLCRPASSPKPLRPCTLAVNSFPADGPNCSLPPWPIPISDTLPSHHRPARGSPIAVSWNPETRADTSFRDLGEGI